MCRLSDWPSCREARLLARGPQLAGVGASCCAPRTSESRGTVFVECPAGGHRLLGEPQGIRCCMTCNCADCPAARCARGCMPSDHFVGCQPSNAKVDDPSVVCCNRGLLRRLQSRRLLRGRQRGTPPAPPAIVQWVQVGSPRCRARLCCTTQLQCRRTESVEMLLL